MTELYTAFCTLVFSFTWRQSDDRGVRIAAGVMVITGIIALLW